MKMLKLISFLNNSIFNLIVSSVLLLVSSASVASTKLPFCEHFFLNGIESHGEDGYVRFNYNAQLVNGSDYLRTKAIYNNKWSIKKSCVVDGCKAYGFAAPDLPPGPILETNLTNEFIIPASKKVTVGANNVRHYGKVALSEWSVGTFKQQSEPYVITQLDVGYKSKLQLPAGEYWVSRLKLEVEGRIDVIGEGQVTLYVIDSMWIPFNFKLNENTKNPAKLAIYTYSDSNYYTGSKTYAFIRSEGEVILNHRAEIVGGVLGKYINLDTESRVIYDHAAAKNLNFKNYCRAFPFPLDTEPPIVVINQFDDYTEKDRTLVTGTIIDSGENASGVDVNEVTINIDGAWVPLPLTGDTFSIELPLPNADNWFTISAFDRAGNDAFIPFYAGRIFPE